MPSKRRAFLFGDLELRLDPWQVEYGPELPRDSDDESADESPAFDVELPLTHWTPLEPTHALELDRLAFVDGVRRLDARVIAQREHCVLHGGFGSHAVGSVFVAGSSAVCGEPRIGRVLVLGGGECVPELVQVA